MFKLSHGGSYHWATAYGKGSGVSLELKDINCEESDVLLNDCDIEELVEMKNQHGRDLGITCFEQAVTGT